MKPKLATMVESPTLVVALGFGVGLSRWAPGTMGSIIGLFLFLGMSALPASILLVVIIVGSLMGVWICERAALVVQQKDPGCIVWDEIVGMWCALLLVPLEPLWLTLSFFLFRMLDILKPGPIGWLDKNLKGGLGIMADDLAAGVVTAVGIHGLLLLI